MQTGRWIFAWAAVALCCAFLACCGGTGQSAAPTTDRAGQPRLELSDLSDAQLGAVFEDPSDELDFSRRAAALVAGLERDPALLTLIESRAVSAVDPRVRELCARALGHYRAYSSIEALGHAIKDSDPQVRAAACWALGMINDPETAPLLAAGLDDPEPIVRIAALEALAAFGPEIAIPALNGRRIGLDFLEERGAETCAASGRTIYVDADAGDDRNPGSAERPLKTLSAAAALLEPASGMTILATAGRGDVPFRETVKLGPNAAGAPGCPTRLAAWPGRPAPLILCGEFHPLSELVRRSDEGGSLYELRPGSKPLRVLASGMDGPFEIPLRPGPDESESAAWIAGESLLIRGDVGGGVWISVREDGVAVDHAPYVEISGLEVNMAADSGVDFAHSPHGACLGCEINTAGRHGIFFYYSPFGLAADSKISACGFQGISVRSSPDTLVVRSSSIDNGVDGVLFLFDSDRGAVIDSTITGNLIRGVGADAGSNQVRVVGCTLEPNYGPPYRADPSSSIQVIAR